MRATKYVYQLLSAICLIGLVFIMPIMAQERRLPDAIRSEYLPRRQDDAAREQDGVNVRSTLSDRDISELEQHVFDLVNQERVSNGSPPVKMDWKLSELARIQAEYMMTHNLFRHIDVEGRGPQLRAKDAGIQCHIDENLGWQSGRDSPIIKIDDLHRSFMNEPKNEHNHRSILLGINRRYVGIGIAVSQNEVYMVQDYADSDPSAVVEPNN
jgi:uncharacterized protein YkwD